jgi:hypothetical protein
MTKVKKSRAQRRTEAAEQVCRAFRKGCAHAGTQEKYFNVALNWLLVWMRYAPAKVKFADPEEK